MTIHYTSILIAMTMWTVEIKLLYIQKIEHLLNIKVYVWLFFLSYNTEAQANLNCFNIFTSTPEMQELKPQIFLFRQAPTRATSKNV